MILSKLRSKFSRTPPERALYNQIVALARQKWLYLEAGAPDTVTGRFHMISLHQFLVLEHLAGKDEQSAEFSQKLFDEMFMDMDRALREMGVGDLSVGKKIQKMSESFYGVSAAYREAFSQPPDECKKALLDIFKRNITADDTAPEKLENLADYAQRVKAQILQTDVEDLRRGKLMVDDVTTASN